MKQVQADHYQFRSYLSPAHWSSYWVQLDSVLESRPATALIVGVGDGVVPRYLTDQGVRVDTLDVDPALKPTFVGDLGTFRAPEGRRYDVVLCCQVLEHLPFERLPEAMDRLLCLTDRLIVSLPYSHVALARLELRAPVVKYFRVAVCIPKFWKRWRYDGQHHWELGTRGFGLRMFRRWLRMRSEILAEYSSFSNPYHRFFVLKRRG